MPVYEDAGDRPHIREDWQPSQETRAFHPELAAALEIKKKSAGPVDQRDHKETEAELLDRINPQLVVITQVQTGAQGVDDAKRGCDPASPGHGELDEFLPAQTSLEQAKAVNQVPKPSDQWPMPLTPGDPNSEPPWR